MVPMASRARAVIWLERPRGSLLSGVAFERMERDIPVLIPAPQAPRNRRRGGDVLPAALKLYQRRRQVDLTASVSVGGEQAGANQDVVLWAVHMTKGLGHQMVQNLNRVCGGGFQAKGEDLVNPFGMALVANEMPFNTAGFAPLFFVAERAFHFSAAGKIFQRRAAEQALFLHDHCLLSVLF